MTTTEVPATAADHAENQLRQELADLHVRAKRAAAQLADINVRLALLQEQIQRHQQRR
ncbi:hypothetical protein [Micromonospora sp. NPDC005806]|uniref:hypothetical protein n=1 Tax=Micromonospora sp. NPDC005806 TaxID=3364234 RepID=UPI003674F464